MNPRESMAPDPDLNATEVTKPPEPERTIANFSEPDFTDEPPSCIGKYEIVRELGRGSMGRVYEARHPIMRNNVAIKVIHSDPSENPEDVAFKTKKLFDEARRAGILSHPNVVTVKDVDSNGGTAFIVMEFVKGATLEDWLTGDKPLEPAFALDVLRQMADALDYAHSKNIIHRDIKPANVMIMEDNRVKVADFGIAKDLADPAATKAGVVMGTPYYMAPEQILAKPLTGRTDQFALAVLAFRLLTGHRPFEAESITGLLFQIVNAPPRSPVELNKNLRLGVSAALEKALAKDPAQRYATCRDFIDDLGNAVLGVRATAVITTPRQPRRRITYFGLPVLALILVAIAITLKSRDSGSSAGSSVVQQSALPQQMHLRQIVFDSRKKSGMRLDAVRDQAQEVRRRIVEGADFSALATRFSDDPVSDLGRVGRGRLPPEVERVAFALKPNELSTVIDAGGVFYILQAAGPLGFPKSVARDGRARKAAPAAKPARTEPPAQKPPEPPPPTLIDIEEGPKIPRPVK